MSVDETPPDVSHVFTDGAGSRDDGDDAMMPTVGFAYVVVRGAPGIHPDSEAPPLRPRAAYDSEHEWVQHLRRWFAPFGVALRRGGRMGEVGGTRIPTVVMAETRAVMAAVQEAPRAKRLVIHTDSQVVVDNWKRFILREAGPNEWGSLSHRWMWEGIKAAVTRRKSRDGDVTLLEKVASHGKVTGQDPFLSWGNAEADEEAGLAQMTIPDIEAGPPPLSSGYVLQLGGTVAVLSPRLAIKAQRLVTDGREWAERRTQGCSPNCLVGSTRRQLQPHWG